MEKLRVIECINDLVGDAVFLEDRVVRWSVTTKADYEALFADLHKIEYRFQELTKTLKDEAERADA